MLFLDQYTPNTLLWTSPLSAMVAHPWPNTRLPMTQLFSRSPCGSCFYRFCFSTSISLSIRASSFCILILFLSSNDVRASSCCAATNRASKPLLQDRASNSLSMEGPSGTCARLECVSLNRLQFCQLNQISIFRLSTILDRTYR